MLKFMVEGLALGALVASGCKPSGSSTVGFGRYWDAIPASRTLRQYFEVMPEAHAQSAERTNELRAQFKSQTPRSAPPLVPIR